MSEYQRYEFMTIDRPLTREQLDAVNMLSSHIEATSAHALIEYHWGDFKHDPIKVLHKYFDAFLYWANWGAPELAFRFPRGVLPADLVDGYGLEDFVAFTRHKDYDILDIHFEELEGPDEWIDYELGPLIAIRDELMDGDLRSLYIVWLAGRNMRATYNREDDAITMLPVPPGFGALTAAQQALAELLMVPQELLVAAARHSSAAKSSAADDIATLITLLPPDRRDEYLIRLARNEPGLGRLLARELRELGGDHAKAPFSSGEHVAFATLLAESKAIKAELEREQREQERLAHLRHLQDIHDYLDKYWHQVDIAVERRSGVGYDEATELLVELREAANHFKEAQQFQERFHAWVRPHLGRPAFVKRLQMHRFVLPET
jgi:hypothetical protein